MFGSEELDVSDDRSVRARSFGAVATQYDTFRPALPAAFNERLGLALGVHVVEVAAGTGLATRTLLESGADVIAVEPDENMLRTLQTLSPGADARHGSAEHVPVDDAWADFLIVVNAWHWVNVELAATEASRVLRVGGSLVVVRNGTDNGDPKIHQMLELRRPHRRRESPDPDRVAPPPDGTILYGSTNSTRFDAPVSGAFRWSWSRSVDQLVGLMGTYSGVITTSPEEQTRIHEATRELANDLADASGNVTVPMLTAWSQSVRRGH
jgi:ubiquinone/menaquinone biosynthesis C-methylase UbiE